jgi:hypothetical protein
MNRMMSIDTPSAVVGRYMTEAPGCLATWRFCSGA